ncbi:hypothetical protein LAZ67_19000003 [Cordylochernes scorpioides]|uniref:Uncharacterized protein n=1 Tax=Cordylochernes scorpioides TaxID=51811 RepID=A0ABY6LGR7_9ARAC|nr:hypothetical protein LAZ67_19000003 [Cordylochernes scorpioides]
MKGRRYATLDEIKTASKEELKKIFKNDFLKCFEDWKKPLSQAVVVEAEWKAWECPYTKNEDTVALRTFREHIKVELGAKDGDRRVLTDYMVDEV